MRRGCISSGHVKCDDCQSLIPHPERYLAIEKEDGTTERLCVDCALKRGYARNKMERGELVLTFMEEGVGGKGAEKAEAEEKEEKEAEKAEAEEKEEKE